jgi:hypothetical protein
MKAEILLFAVLVASVSADAEDSNQWIQVSEDAVGPRHSPGLVWSEELDRFVLFGGAVSHHFQDERPYDVQTFDLASRQWFNHLPGQARSRGGETGNVEDPGYKSPYFALVDNDGLVAPNRRHTVMWYKYAHAPWDGKIYSLVCGRTLCYDPKLRQWNSLQPNASPSPSAPSYKRGLAWSATGADLVMLGYILEVDGGRVVPFYDCENNQWLVAELSGSEFIAGERGYSVDLGLVYDAKRGFVWGVKCNLRGRGALNVLRFDRETARIRVLR